MKNKVIVLSGNGKPAISANNIYMQELSKKYEILIVEERITVRRILFFLKNKFTKNGFIYIFNFILLRLYRIVFVKDKDVEKKYKPFLVVNDINEEAVKKVLEEEKYEFVISNACSILNQKIINASKKQIINLHNGINPRYRGTGNFWAYYEKKYECIGATIHYVDKGIDTGKIITVKKDDGTIIGDDFDSIDINAFRLGAKEISKVVLKKNSFGIAKEFQNLTSKCYSYPGLTHYFKAKRNFNNYKKMSFDAEKVWQKSFIDKALNKNGSSLEKQHWSDEKIVAWHDGLIIEKINKIDKKYILDIGCGDARYINMLNNFDFYIGVDYSFETMKINKDDSFGVDIKFSFPLDTDLGDRRFLTKNNMILIESKADSLPVKNNCANIILAVGLFQHLNSIEDVVREISRCLMNDGKIIINTLKKFSNFELLLIFLLLGWKKDIRNLVFSIYKGKYGHVVNGTLLARRYSYDELEKEFTKNNLKIEGVAYDGLFGSSFMAREIILEVTNV